MPERLPAYPFQAKALEHTWRSSAAALFLDPGLGKSKITIDTACKLAEKQVIRAVVVFAPTLIAGNWAGKEIPTHGWDDFRHDVFHWEAGDRRKVRLVKHALSESPAEGTIWWFCFNRQAIQNKTLFDELRKFASRVPSLLVIDESQCLKNYSKQTRLFTSLGKHFTARRILTGTPQTNSVKDNFYPYKFLDERILGVTSMDDFQRYYTTGSIAWGYKYDHASKKQVRAQQYVCEDLNSQFYERVAPCTVRIKKADVLPDLPEKAYEHYFVELTGPERDMYNKLKKEKILELMRSHVSGAELSGQVLARNALALTVRLQQVISGIIATEDAGRQQFISSKRQAALELLETRKGPVIVFANFRLTVDFLTSELQKLGRSAEKLYGGTDKRTVPDILKRYSQGDIDFLVVHPKTGGTGMTWTEGYEMVFVENSYSLEDRIQCEDRIHRIGQKNACQYIDIVVRDSIDEVIREALDLKQNAADRAYKQLMKDFL